MNHVTTDAPVASPGRANRTSRTHAVSNKARLASSFPSSPIYSSDYSPVPDEDNNGIPDLKMITELDPQMSQAYYGLPDADEVTGNHPQKPRMSTVSSTGMLGVSKKPITTPNQNDRLARDAGVFEDELQGYIPTQLSSNSPGGAVKTNLLENSFEQRNSTGRAQAQEYYRFNTDKSTDLSYAELNSQDSHNVINSGLGIAAIGSDISRLWQNHVPTPYLDDPSKQIESRPDDQLARRYDSVSDLPEAYAELPSLPEDSAIIGSPRFLDTDVSLLSSMLAAGQDELWLSDRRFSKAYYNFNLEDNSQVDLSFNWSSSENLVNNSLGISRQSEYPASDGTSEGLIKATPLGTVPTPNKADPEKSGRFENIPFSTKILNSSDSPPPFDTIWASHPPSPPFDTTALEEYDERTLRASILQNIVKTSDIGDSQAYLNMETEAKVNLSFSSAPVITPGSEQSDMNGNAIASMLMPNLHPPTSFDPIRDSEQIVTLDKFNTAFGGSIWGPSLNFNEVTDDNPAVSSSDIKRKSVELAQREQE